MNCQFSGKINSVIVKFFFVTSFSILSLNAFSQTYVDVKKDSVVVVGTNSILLKGDTVRASLNRHGLDMKNNSIYNAKHLYVNYPLPSDGWYSAGINIGMKSGTQNQIGLKINSLDYPTPDGDYSRVQIDANSGGSGGYFMPKVRMYDVNGVARFSIDGRGLGYVAADLTAISGLGDGALYTRDVASGNGLFIKPYGIKQEATGLDIISWSSDFKTRYSIANLDYTSNNSNNRIYNAKSYEKGQIIADSGWVNNAMVQWYGNHGFTLGIYGTKRGVLFPNLNEATIGNLETSSIDNASLDMMGRYIASSGNMFWNRDRNRFGYLYRLDTTATNIGFKGTSLAAEGLPSNNIRTASSTETIDLKFGSYFKLAISGDITFALKSVFNGTKVFIELTNNNTSHNLTFPAEWKWVGAAPAVVSSGEAGFITLTIFDSNNIFAEYKQGT